MDKEVVFSSRAGERGAISIKAVLMLLIVAAVVFIVIKGAPIYVEQRKVIYDVDELARVATIRGWKEDKINQDIAKIRGEYDLPEGSINLLPRDKNVQIVIAYQRDIDLLVTTYTWKVDHTAVGKEL